MPLQLSRQHKDKQKTTQCQGMSALEQAAEGLQAPTCPAYPQHSWHGPWERTEPDPYQWLRSEGPTSPQVLSYLGRENAYAEAVLGRLSHLRDEVHDDMARRVPLQEQSATWWGPAGSGSGYTYQRRRSPQDSHWRTVRWPVQKELQETEHIHTLQTQQQHLDGVSIHVQVQQPDVDDASIQTCTQQQALDSTSSHVQQAGVEVVLDENILAESYKYLHVAAQQVSSDGTMLAYLMDTQGNERHSLWVKQLCSPCQATASKGHSACKQEAAEAGYTWQVAEGVCGPYLAWTTDSCGVVVTHLTHSNNEISEVVMYSVNQHSKAAHVLMDAQTSRNDAHDTDSPHVSLTWMGELAEGNMLAVAAHWSGGCELCLVPLPSQLLLRKQHMEQPQSTQQQQQRQRQQLSNDLQVQPQQQETAPEQPLQQGRGTSSTKSLAAAYQVALPWQDDWDIHKVDLHGSTLLLLVDSDSSPDGKVLAVPYPTASTTQGMGDNKSRTKHTAQSGLPAIETSVLVVPGSDKYELRQLAVLGQYMAVSRTEKLLTHIDFYQLPAAGSDVSSYRQLQKCWSWCPLDCYAAVRIQAVRGPTAATAACQTCNGAGSMDDPIASRENQQVVWQQKWRLRVTFSCMTTPETTMELDPDTRAVHTVHVEEVVGFERPEMQQGQCGQQLSSEHQPQQQPPIQEQPSQHFPGHQQLSQPFPSQQFPSHQQASHHQSYISQLVWVPATYSTQTSGTSKAVQVPISLAYRRDMYKADGTNTCVMHVYGAYGSRQQPSFNPMDLALLDRGVVLAIAHVRGGGELGCAWHKMGRRHHKPDTFRDVLAAARGLCELDITSWHKLVLWGRSAGGLAAAAAIAQQPNLCQAALLDVPFLDVLTPMCDPSLPLTHKERTEWGDPLRSQEEHDLIRSYSPYHALKSAVTAACSQAATGTFPTQKPAGRNAHTSAESTLLRSEQVDAAVASTAAAIEAAAEGPAVPSGDAVAAACWPHMLITTSMQDERVPYWVPARYVARLRAALRDGKPGNTLQGHAGLTSNVQQPVVCFVTDQSAGHFGSGAAQSRLAARADKCAFLLAATG